MEIKRTPGLEYMAWHGMHSFCSNVDVFPESLGGICEGAHYLFISVVFSQYCQRALVLSGMNVANTYLSAR